MRSFAYPRSKQKINEEFQFKVIKKRELPGSFQLNCEDKKSCLKRNEVRMKKHSFVSLVSGYLTLSWTRRGRENYYKKYCYGYLTASTFLRGLHRLRKALLNSPPAASYAVERRLRTSFHMGVLLCYVMQVSSSYQIAKLLQDRYQNYQHKHSNTKHSVFPSEYTLKKPQHFLISRFYHIYYWLQ